MPIVPADTLPRLASLTGMPERACARELVRALAREAATRLSTRRIVDLREGQEGPIDVIDMFSGCGGMSAGFAAFNAELPTYHLAAALDVDPVANSSFEGNLGLSPTAVDIGQFAGSGDMLQRVLAASFRREGAPLVLIGCAPCQGFSSHRNSAGEHDARNSLFGDFARVAVRLGPEAILAENVPEILTDRYWPYVLEARRVLEDAGYFVHVGVHNMAEFGVPQERFRALMMAMRRPFEPPQGFLTREQFKTVRTAISDLRPVKPGEIDSHDSLHRSANHKPTTVDVIRAVPKDGGNRPENTGPRCLARARQRNGKSAYEDVYGRLAWDRPAITITAHARNPASGRFVHPEQDRGLTIREAALLQGFPRDYWFAGSLDEAFRQIGNAVPPAFSTYLAGHVLGELLADGPQADSFDVGLQKPVGTSFSRLIPSLKAKGRTRSARR